MPVPAKLQPHVLDIPGFLGLSLYSDARLRTKDTWQQLDNFDLVVDGSIRKVLPPLLISGPFANVLYQLLEYRKAINFEGGGLRDIALDALGNLWDIDGSTSVPYSTSLVATIAGGVSDIPFMGQMQGFYVPFTIKTWIKNTAYNLNDAVYRYSAVDGNLYVYFISTAGISGALEPKWLLTGPISDGTAAWGNAGILNSERFKLNYGIVVAKSYPAMKFVEWKYDPTNASETPKITGNRIGVSLPLAPLNVTPNIITPNLNGYSPISGRAYVFTYYNPNTLHDSSPSPFVGPTKFTNLDNAGNQKQLTGSILPPLPMPLSTKEQFKSYQSVYLEGPLSALTPAYGDGYTCIRCWATEDGGATFFLLDTLYDNAGNVVTNGDGSIPIATLQALSAANAWTGFAPLPTPQNAVATFRVFDGGGGTSINLIPDPQNLGPESWSETVGTQLSVVPGASPTGQAAFEYVGTASAAPDQRYRTFPIAVIAGQSYTFQGYIDDTNGTGGTVAWDILDIPGYAAIASYVQADATAGQVGGTFVPPHNQISVRAHVTGVTAPDGEIILLGDPILEKGTSISAVAVTYPTPDTSLVLPAPVPQSQNPPPSNCLVGAIFANVLFLVDYNNPSNLYYSNLGDFNSYGVNAFIQFPSDRTPSIMELIATYDRLLVSSGRSIDQVLSNSPNAGFARYPFDPQHGSLSYRGSIPYGSGCFALQDAGIALLNLAAKLGGLTSPGGITVQTGFTPESIISRPIKPLLDLIAPATVHVDSDIPGEPLPVIDNNQDLYILGYQGNEGSTFMDTLVMMPLRGTAQGQFSRVPVLPGNGQVTAMKEIQLVSDRMYGVLALTGDKKVFQLFGGIQDGSLTAVALTQPLPTKGDIEPELWDTTKVFQEIYLDGVDLTNFVITAFDDAGVAYGPWSVYPNQNSINLGGIRSRQITLQFIHAKPTTLTPELASLNLTFDIVGPQP
jgi:hypothetical protein